jgi:hypothetical protein
MENPTQTHVWRGLRCGVAPRDRAYQPLNASGIHANSLSHTAPLLVQHWDVIIALNSAAREHALSRGMSVNEVKAKCIEVVLQHVAT